MFDFWQGAPDLPVYGFLIRAVIVYLYIFILIKLLGQRSMTAMNPIDFLFGIIIGDVVGEPLSDGDIALAGPLSAAALIGGIHLFLSYLALKMPRFRRVIEDEPIILMEKGRILHKQMEKAKVTVESLFMDLRQQEASDLTEVDYAVLEPNGQISVIKKTRYDTATPDDFNLSIKNKGYPTVLIQDGRYIDANIQKYVSRDWLHNKLLEKGYSDVKDVFLLTLNESGDVYISGK